MATLAAPPENHSLRVTRGTNHMKNVIAALAVSFAVGFGASARAESVRPEPNNAPSSCKAAGQPCSDREDCCSRMCRKDNHKCS